jgi:hypothetical protein
MLRFRSTKNNWATFSHLRSRLSIPPGTSLVSRLSGSFPAMFLPRARMRRAVLHLPCVRAGTGLLQPSLSPLGSPAATPQGQPNLSAIQKRPPQACRPPTGLPPAQGPGLASGYCDRNFSDGSYLRAIPCLCHYASACLSGREQAIRDHFSHCLARSAVSHRRSSGRSLPFLWPARVLH